jgi:cytochrome P450
VVAVTTANHPPGPRGLPLVGNTHQWMRDPCAFRERCAERYGPVVNYDVIGTDTYMLTDPEDVERVLVHESERFPKHEDSTQQLRRTLGDGLLTSDGSLWERQREAIQPAFYMDHIQRYVDVMVERSAVMVDDWADGDRIDVEQAMTELTLEILVDAMFADDGGSAAADGVGERPPDADGASATRPTSIDLEARGIYDAVDDLREPLQPRNQPITFLLPEGAPVPFLRRAVRAREHIEDQIYDILEERRSLPADRQAEQDDLLSMLLSSDAEMDDEQIRDEMMTFLFAGHETTALTLTYLWDLLSRSPEAERRLHAELDASLDGRPGFQDLFDLDYTEAVVREAMRLYPVAHEIRRQPVEDVEIAGYTVPEGSLIVLPTWVLHRDDRFWEAPEEFRPERWLDRDDERRPGTLGTPSDRPDFAYFPFGGGPRSCIGRQFAMTEAQLIVATIARQYALDREYGDLDISAAVTLQPKTDVEMSLRER